MPRGMYAILHLRQYPVSPSYLIVVFLHPVAVNTRSITVCFVMRAVFLRMTSGCLGHFRRRRTRTTFPTERGISLMYACCPFCLPRFFLGVSIADSARRPSLLRS